VVVVPLPDAPLGVQVDAGPQRGTLLVTWTPARPGDVGQSSAMQTLTVRGTLLVTWTPVPDKKPVDEEAASLIRAITGYAVYVDGTMVKQLDSPSGQLYAATRRV